MTMPSVRSLWGMAFALSLGAAISLGMARFSYGLLLPPMRDDLAWSYTLAGAMNTANALGYLLGAMALPRMLRRWDAVQVFMTGGDGIGLGQDGGEMEMALVIGIQNAPRLGLRQVFVLHIVFAIVIGLPDIELGALDRLAAQTLDQAAHQTLLA